MTRNTALYLLIGGLLVLALFSAMSDGPQQQQANEISYSEFLDRVEAGQVSEVHMRGQEIEATYQDGTRIETFAPEDHQLMGRLDHHGVRVSAEEPPSGPNVWGILLSWFPFLLLIAVMVYFMRRSLRGGGPGGLLNVGKSKARMLTEQHGRVTFDDVAGIDEAKGDLQEIVDFLKDPTRFSVLGGKIPKGMLLVGPPGTGKTLLARAIAGEANVPFFTVSGSDFVEMFVGVGASRVRDMFEQAKNHQPCIIFIDEIDAVGRQRGAGMGGGNDEREQTVNQLLTEMDGFEENSGIIIIAATNRPDVLDPALTRPGRFDRQVVVPNPDVLGREKILKVHMRKVPLAADVDPKIIARGTPGFSGADLANLVNEAALLAARRNKRVVSMAELEDAKDKVTMGDERRSMVLTDDQKRLTAYHEAGHAVVAIHMEESDPIHKATIIPRGRALGMVMRLPERDRLSITRAKLEADLAVAMGGRIAEELIFGEEMVTTGASSDIKMATDIARRMVTEWGMSDKLGPLTYGEPSQEVFLGHSVTQHQTMSDETIKAVDGEIKRIVDEAYNLAHDTLTGNMDQLHTLAKGLLEYETLDAHEIDALLRGEPIVRSDKSDSSADGSGDGSSDDDAKAQSAARRRGKRPSGSVPSAHPKPTGA